MKKMISVIIPCYNVENYVETCIKSIIDQSYENFEIICVNDGSTDLTREKLETLKMLDNRITVIEH